MNTKALLIKGAGMADITFTLVTHWGEEITWNVTKMRADCVAGEFGVPRYGRISELPPADWSAWDGTDRATVEWIKDHPEVLEEPAIAIASPNPSHLYLVFCDGQHRITAKQELGAEEYSFYVVPWAREGDYRVTMEVVDAR